MGEGRDEPGGEAVGIHRDAQGGALISRLKLAEVRAQRGLQSGHLLGMAAQAQAGGGGCARLAAHHQHGAGALFQELDALRHGRGRDSQRKRRLVEAAGADDRGQCGQMVVIEMH